MRHPHGKTVARDALSIDAIVGAYLAATREEEPALAANLEGLDDEGRLNLAGILGRLDHRGKAPLDAQGRARASRILRRLHRPTTPVLVLTNKILDYLDVNTNAILEEDELELCLECFELFARAESANETLSERELELLYAVLRHLDSNDNHVLDAHERRQLRVGLDQPEVFLAEASLAATRAENPDLA